MHCFGGDFSLTDSAGTMKEIQEKPRKKNWMIENFQSGINKTKNLIVITLFQCKSTLSLIIKTNFLYHNAPLCTNKRNFLVHNALLFTRNKKIVLHNAALCTRKNNFLYHIASLCTQEPGKSLYTIRRCLQGKEILW
jgi:hypothetical protein